MAPLDKSLSTIVPIQGRWRYVNHLEGMIGFLSFSQKKVYCKYERLQIIQNILNAFVYITAATPLLSEIQQLFKLFRPRNSSRIQNCFRNYVLYLMRYLYVFLMLYIPQIGVPICLLYLKHKHRY